MQRLRPIRHLPLAVAATLAISGCTLGPDYKRPDIDVPVAWRATPAASAGELAAKPAAAASAVGYLPADMPPVGAAELADTAWWSAFGDPVLDQLIQTALENNKDLRIAALRIQEYDAFLQVTRAAGLPQVGAGASRTRDTLSENRQVPLAVGTEPVGNSYEVLGRVAWELDFWGKFRRANESALAQLMASEETRRGLVLTLVSDVAAAYVQLRSLDSELEVLQRSVASGRETLRLLESKYAGGGISEVPVIQARAALEELTANLPVKEQGIAKLENGLSALLGRNPGPIERGKPITALALPAIPGGLPAELLVRRPDIRKAEQDLIAANAKIGVAKAQYLPDISLTASSGYASTDLSNLTLLTSNFGSFGVTLLGPIFTSGRIAGQVREAESAQQQTATAYLLAVQAGLREVEDALVSHRKTYQRLGIRTRQLDALRAARESAKKRYAGGYTGYLEVLAADRDVDTGELQYSQTRFDQYSALIAVYKAMGGGWKVADALAPSTSQTKKTAP